MKTMMKRILRTPSRLGLTAGLAIAVTLAGILSAACGGTHSVAGPGALATIAVTPNATLAIKATQQFLAVGRDAAGGVVSFSPTWSLEAGGGTIDAAGLFTAGTTAGTYTSTVKASSGGISGTASVTVTNGVVTTISVTPSSVSLPPNAAQLFMAVGKDAAGNVVAVSPTWSIVAGGGTINSIGRFTAGVNAGTFANTVQATSGGLSGNATVIVYVSTGSHGPAPVALGSAGNYAILAKSAVSNVPTSAIAGDLGLSPAAASFITGFALSLPAGGAFSTSPQVTGNIYASDYAVPTPSTLTTAIGDMQTAYTDAAGRSTPDYTELGSGNIGGLTLPAGLYKWTNTVTIPSNLTLDGGATDVWIFQVAGGLTQSSATQVILTGGALAKNVFWQVAGVVTIGSTAHMEGELLSQTAITLQSGASVSGRLLAQTAVTLGGNTIVEQ